MASAVSVAILFWIILFVGPLFYHLPRVRKFVYNSSDFFTSWLLFSRTKSVNGKLSDCLHVDMHMNC